MTERHNDGGPAFPMQDFQAIHAYAMAAVDGITGTDERDRAYTLAKAEAVGGMSLRDYFAARAMQGDWAAQNEDAGFWNDDTEEKRPCPLVLPHGRRDVARQGKIMNTHTPGPWIVCTQDGDSNAYTVFQETQLRDGRIRAEDWDHCIATAGLDHSEYEANARLVAAAPDLFESLAATRAYLLKCSPHEDDIDGAEWGRLMDASGAAIAKAEGKS